jgi:hypothetical protein
MFTIESYGAWHGKPLNMRLAGVAIGADLYFVYHPGSSGAHPAFNSDLQFIQVLYDQIGMDLRDNQVDTGRADPFYGDRSGLTSIDGHQSVSFPTLSTRGSWEDPAAKPAHRRDVPGAGHQDEGRGRQGHRQHFRRDQMELANEGRSVKGATLAMSPCFAGLLTWL